MAALTDGDIDYLSKLLRIDRKRLEILVYVQKRGGKVSTREVCKALDIPRSTLYNRVNISPSSLRARGLAMIHRSQVYADQIGIGEAIKKLMELKQVGKTE